MDIRKESELRVLRHLQNGGNMMIPDGMDEHEFRAACYRLEKNNCVRLARIEGGGFEAIRMLDEGFVYLKELEMEEENEKGEFKHPLNVIADLEKQSENQKSVIFEKTRKFVEDTQYFYTIIMSKEFYNRTGDFYLLTKSRFDLYCVVNEDDLVNEVNKSPLQTYFDDYKKLLNSIDLPDKDLLGMSFYIQENLTIDRGLLEEAIDIFRTIVDKCGNLRNSLENFMSLYDLKDNFPKKGFLRPLYFDEAIEKEEIRNRHSEKNAQKNAKKKEKNKPGRPSAKPFEVFIRRDAPSCFINILENMLDGKTGIAAGLIIYSCIGYWINEPTKKSVVERFPSVKSTSFSTAMNNKSNFPNDKVIAIREEIERKIKEVRSKKGNKNRNK